MGQAKLITHPSLKKITATPKASPAVKEHIIIYNKEMIHVVKLSDITYLQSESNYTHIYLRSGGHLLASKPLIQFDQLLTRNGFVRIHQSFLIKPEDIIQFHRKKNELTLSNGNIVKVAKSKSQMVLELMKQRCYSLSGY